MDAIARLVAYLWLGFAVVWLGSALFNKRSRRAPWQALAVRLAIVGVILLLNVRWGRSVALGGFQAQLPLVPGEAARWVGTALCAGGLLFAVWARVHIGRNWGLPMSMRESHELVTSGPYARVRHPIYSGILLAMLGSALAQSVMWAAAFLLFLPYFYVSARIEERMLQEVFPQAYPPYRARTRMLIPFLL